MTHPVPGALADSAASALSLKSGHADVTHHDVGASDSALATRLSWSRPPHIRCRWRQHGPTPSRMIHCRGEDELIATMTQSTATSVDDMHTCVRVPAHLATQGWLLPQRRRCRTLRDGHGPPSNRLGVPLRIEHSVVTSVDPSDAGGSEAGTALHMDRRPAARTLEPTSTARSTTAP